MKTFSIFFVFLTSACGAGVNDSLGNAAYSAAPDEITFAEQKPHPLIPESSVVIEQVASTSEEVLDINHESTP